MIKKVDVKSKEVARAILNVQLPSYQIEAELIGFYGIPVLKDTIHTLQQCGETFYGFFIDDELVGAVSHKIEDKVLDIHRMIVHPKHFRKGIASSLLKHVLQLAKASNIDRVVVSTGAKNTPAKNLYKRYNFIETREEVEISEGISISLFEKLMIRK